MLLDREPLPEELPHGWTVTRLGEVCTESQRRADSSDTPVLSVTKHQGMVLSSEYFGRRVHSADTSKYKVVFKGQYAYATIHLNEGSIGLLRNFEVGLVSPMYTVFSLRAAHLDPEYLYAVLKQPSSLKLFQSLVQGTVNRRGAIPFSRFAQLFVVHPPIIEQRKIATILSSVNDNIEKTESVIGQLEVVKKGLFAELLTQGMPRHRGRTKQTEYGVIPENWQVRRVRDLLRDDSSLAYGILQPGRDVENGVPMLRTVDIEDGRRTATSILRVDRTIEAQYERTRLMGGEVLLSVMGTVGESIVVPSEWRGWNVNRALAVIRLGPTILPDFFCFWLRSPSVQQSFRTESIGSAQLRINLSNLREKLVPVPTLSEQSEIIDALNIIEKRHLSDRVHVEQLRLVKESLLSALLSGSIRVSDTAQEAA